MNNLDSTQKAAQEQFGRQSQRYAKGHLLEDVQDVAAAVALCSGLPQKADVLDVATGAGFTGLYLASLGHRVILADLAQPMLDRAGEKAVQRGLKVDLRQHAAEELPYPDQSFDLVTCRVAAHHFSSPARFVVDTARILRPGGYFLLIDGSIPDHEAEVEQWLHRVEKWRDPSHARFLAPTAWRELCSQAGLSVMTAELQPLKQPDLEWYFTTANTSAENRALVLHAVETASDHVRRVMQLENVDGKIIWVWQRLTLVARKV